MGGMLNRPQLPARHRLDVDAYYKMAEAGGMLLALTAATLAHETKGLLIGESADPAIIASILDLAAEIDGVANANGVLTIHLAPDQILVALSLEFADQLTTPIIEAKVLDLERRLRARHPSHRRFRQAADFRGIRNDLRASIRSHFRHIGLCIAIAPATVQHLGSGRQLLGRRLVRTDWMAAS
jgi:hypothetical protein